MKKILLTLSAALLLVFAGCSGSGSPKAVADKFAENFLVKFQPEKLQKYCTDDFSQDMIPSTEEEKMFMEVFRTSIKAMKFQYKYNEEESEIDENYATIVYDVTSKTEPGMNQEMEVELKKVNNKWKVYDFTFDLF